MDAERCESRCQLPANGRDAVLRDRGPALDVLANRAELGSLRSKVKLASLVLCRGSWLADGGKAKDYQQNRV